MVDGHGGWSQSELGRHHICNSWLRRSRHFIGARRHSASGFPLVSAGSCRRTLDHIVWSGIPTPENAGKGDRACLCSRTPCPSWSCRLALLDRRPAANWRVRLFWICCSPHLRPRSFLLRKSPPLDWFEVVAAAPDNRNECHSLSFSQGFRATSLPRRSTARRRILSLCRNDYRCIFAPVSSVGKTGSRRFGALSALTKCHNGSDLSLAQFWDTAVTARQAMVAT